MVPPVRILRSTFVIWLRYYHLGGSKPTFIFSQLTHVMHMVKTFK